MYRFIKRVLGNFIVNNFIAEILTLRLQGLCFLWYQSSGRNLATNADFSTHSCSVLLDLLSAVFELATIGDSLSTCL